MKRAGVLVLAAAFGLAACKSRGSEVAPVSSATPAASDHDPDDEVQPVYPVDQQPPLPIAEAYCDAVQEKPRIRREACCPGFGAYAPTRECVRTLSAALRSKSVALDEADLHVCVDAAGVATQGCDWVGATGAGSIPAACSGIIKGTLDVGAKCRSNLECAEGLRCHGLGATHAGKCGVADDLHACNVSTDSLAAFTAQTDFNAYHPECSGYCMRDHCVERMAIGAACTASLPCGTKRWCNAGKCASGALPELGRRCTDICAAGARCVKGECAAPKSEGERCEQDADCRVHCERADAEPAGRCARQCPSFPRAPTPPPGGPTKDR